MARVRKIQRRPNSGGNYYLVDANFLANKFIPLNVAPDSTERDRLSRCLEWWEEIDEQLKAGVARVYIPDICIAECFKALAKKYYGKQKWFPRAIDHVNARNRLRKEIVTTNRILRAAKRRIKYHDIPTTRDIIIAVDRFYELFLKYNLRVSLPDLIITATAKYLIDFFDIPKTNLHIITLDKQLWAGCKKIQELPNAYDPTRPSDLSRRIFQGLT